MACAGQERQHPSDVSPDAAARSAGTCATGAHVWQALLDQADQRASAMSHHHQTPATLLEDVVWAVTDPPEKARLDNTCASFAEVPECALCSRNPIPTTAQELLQNSWLCKELISTGQYKQWQTYILSSVTEGE